VIYVYLTHLNSNISACASSAIDAGVDIRVGRPCGGTAIGIGVDILVGRLYGGTAIDVGVDILVGRPYGGTPGTAIGVGVTYLL